MIHNDYPLPTSMVKDHVLPDGWVEVPMSASDVFEGMKNEFARKKFKVLSVDCEMVINLNKIFKF